MHFVMAFVISFVMLGVIGLPTASTTIEELADLKTPNPAAVGGVQAGDKIVAVDNKPVIEWRDAITVLSAPDAVGRTIPLAVERNGQPLSFTVTPVDRRTAVYADGTPVEVVDPNVAAGFIGIQSKAFNETVGPWTAFTRSGENVARATKGVFEALGRIFSPSGLTLYFQNVTGTVPEEKQEQADENRFSSPVGLARVADQAADSGIYAVLALLFSFNMFIGIFNMIPLLPFDGGHVAVAIYEKARSLRGREYHADYAKLLPVSYAVILVMIVIAGSSLWLDIVSPLENPFG
jgi:membrane-associated protease RseP (regulator of RpoE activity)